MARKCPACGASNDDSLGFCQKCGEPVAPELRLAMDLDSFEKSMAQKNSHRPSGPRSSRSRDDDEDYEFEPLQQDDEEKRSILPWIVLGVVAVAIVAWILLK